MHQRISMNTMKKIRKRPETGIETEKPRGAEVTLESIHYFKYQTMGNGKLKHGEQYSDQRTRATHVFVHIRIRCWTETAEADKIKRKNVDVPIQ